MPVGWGGSVRRYETVTSTQDVARDLVREGGAPPGTVVAAAFQTEGRGRRGRVWFAPPGENVCMTAIAPLVRADLAWQIALVAGLALAEAVARLARVRTFVRFPNDVLLAGAKLGGILVETISAENGFVTALIGIGVNVNVAEFPPEVRATATSLERVTGVRRDVVSVERAVLRQLGLCWDEWTHGGLSATLARWTPLLDPDARRAFVLGGEEVVCRVRGLSPEGILTLETGRGVLHELPAAAVILGEGCL